MIFGDYLVDMIWSVDTELDEFLSEARLAATASAEEINLSPKEMSLLTSKAKKVQQNVENDKQRIPVLVKKLLVRDFPLGPSFSDSFFRKTMSSVLSTHEKDLKLRF